MKTCWLYLFALIAFAPSADALETKVHCSEFDADVVLDLKGIATSTLTIRAGKFLGTSGSLAGVPSQVSVNGQSTYCITHQVFYGATPKSEPACLTVRDSGIAGPAYYLNLVGPPAGLGNPQNKKVKCAPAA